MQSSLVPPALLCRVDMVLCMFKNSQLPTQPSAITPRVGKYLSCNQILQKFVRKNFSLLQIGKVTSHTEGNTVKSLLHAAFLSVLSSRSEDETGIMMLQRA